ncbi:hypothetical protein [Roseivivax marinus]|uniref:hypothetical protein n=1 Tax=Roseivivax marinus TaxID=1379903 RepID=UPI000B84308E|nr:hypothetical protein [Roseivivax marinus]
MTLRTATLCLALAASPAAAQAPDEGRSLMEQGAEMFFRGLMSEMEPALQELREFADGVEPALRDFVVEMGPALRELLEEVEDWSAYHPPERLPNGDIILRRREPLPENAPEPDALVPDDEGEIDL